MIVDFNASQTFDVGLDLTENCDVKIDEPQHISVGFDNVTPMDVEMTQEADFVCNFSTGVSSGDYDGPYTVTPSNQRQILATQAKTLDANIVVEPIPSHYGLITYNGVTITVS